MAENTIQKNAVTQNQGSNHAAALLSNLKNSSAKRVEARVFRSNVLSVRYVFKNGKVAPFLTGKYVTDIEHEIIELDEEIASGHPNFSANVEEVVEVIEPLEQLKAKHFEEFKKMVEAAANKNNDAGESIQTKLNVVNSNTVGEATAGSDSSTSGSMGMKISVAK